MGFVLQLFGACVVALLPLGPKGLKWIFFGVMLLLLGGGVLERELSRYDWQVSDKAGLWSALGRGDEVSGYGFRSWRAPDKDAADGGAVAPATLTTEIRRVAGKPAWDWFRSDPGFVLEPESGKDYPHTRVQVPAAQPGAGPPYIMRTFDTGEPLGGRIFRVLLDIRRTPPERRKTAGEAVRETAAIDTRPGDIVRGKPIGGRQCSGLLLQAWGYRGGGRCLSLTLSDTWTRYSLSWRVPEAVDATVVRALLSGFAGETFDVRRVRLFTAKKELGPLLPQGGALNLTWGGRSEAQAGRTFVPTPEWQAFNFEVERSRGNTITAHLFTASGLVLETRNVTLIGADGQKLPEAVSSNRQTIIFGDPNLAGHTLGTLGLALVALSSLPLGVVAAVLTGVGLVLTGSRAALVGVAFGMAGLLWLRLPKRGRLGFTVLGLVLLGGVGALWPRLSALRLFSFGEVTARSDIWRGALEAFLTHPLRGLGTSGFPAYWAETHGGEAVQHAHNVWLEFASSYGVLGLLSVTALTLGVSVLAWRWGGARALAFVGGVLLMNVFDTTLFYAGVLFTLFLTLGAQRRLTPYRVPVHNTVRPDPHNRRVIRQVPPE